MKPTRCTIFLKFIFGIKLYMFRTVPLSIIRTFSLYTPMIYVIQQDQDGKAVPSWSCSQAVSKPVWHILLLCVQWKTPDDGQRNCPKHVEFYSKNKFEKLVHLVGFIIGTISKVHKLIRSIDNIPRTTQYLTRVGARSSYRTAYYISYTKSVSTH